MPMTPHRPALAGFLLAILASFALFPAVAFAAPADSDPQNPIVRVALSYEGSTEGQCWQWVHKVVEEATGKEIGFDYREGFFEAGAIEVTTKNAAPGDIIQIANDSYTGPDADYDGLHTVIILENHGDGTFKVIDSNSQWDGVVRIRETYDPAASAGRYYGLNFHIYRISSGATVPSDGSRTANPQSAPDIKTGDSATVNTPGECLNLRSGAGLSAARIGCLPHGTLVKILSTPQLIAGRYWANVSSSAGDGWVALEYLKAAAPGAGGGAGSGSTKPPMTFRLFIGSIATR
ncbi:hypothetical protein AYO38_06105 [bacterium SCGC AG-212-C10]|nr:hypothetical protein AYO38_06105 [bacterium SCGC AG-212-C10]